MANHGKTRSKKLTLQQESYLYNKKFEKEGFIVRSPISFNVSISPPPLKFAAENGWISNASLILLIGMFVDLIIMMILPEFFPLYGNYILDFGLITAFVLFSIVMIMVRRRSEFSFRWLLLAYLPFSFFLFLMSVEVLLRYFHSPWLPAFNWLLS